MSTEHSCVFGTAKKRQKKTDAFKKYSGQKSPTPEAAKTSPKARVFHVPPKYERKKATTPKQELSEDAEFNTCYYKRERMQRKSCGVRERDVATASGSGSEGSVSQYKRVERKGQKASSPPRRRIF